MIVASNPTLFTIGFTKKSAEKFFSLLMSSGVQRIIDTRISNESQLSGFAKGKDLAYLSEALGGIQYVHRVDMAPTKELLRRYREKEINWARYEQEYRGLLEQRDIKGTISKEEMDNACLLCSEDLPDKCHRRLLAEYLVEAYPGTRLVHLR